MTPSGLLTLSIALLALMTGCGKADPPRSTIPASVVGEYVGHFGGATERLILRPDGTLWQELRNGTEIIYTNEATWTVVNVRGLQDVDLQDFYVAVELQGAERLTAAAMKIAPRKTSAIPFWARESNYQRLVGRFDTPYFFERVASPGPPPPHAEKPK